ncbi:hypothetical protein OS493_006350 [Desmophyllum pertusum]|uniref:Uncharacterized protein n=1 Tax=Desmophyllum pertusum TaxID=174260 RepID=A0A9X0A5X6_9CNID|nr:hypothetical protein OS493_006350 [Desmophyllum pertusum]
MAAVQSRSDIIAEEIIFPLIPHVTPIWPPEKRIENVKARRANFRRLVRNKMILFRFLQSINPTFKDLSSEVVAGKVVDDDGDSIVTLTRNFHEEQRKKHERIYEIQMEAYHRAERKKSVWVKERELECGWPRLLTRERLVTSKGNSNNLTNNQTLMKDLQLTEKHRTIPKIEDNTSSTKATHRKLSKAHTFIRNKSRSETEFRNRGTSRDKATKGKESTLQSRLSGKSLHEKWLETIMPKYNEKNVSTTRIYN